MKTDPQPWKPLLAGEDAEEAVRIVEEIAAALAPQVAEGLPPDDWGRGASLAGGSAGYAIFFDYAAQALGRPEYAELAAQFLDRSIEAVASRPMTFGLYSGFTGIAWTAEHLQGRGTFADLAPETPDPSSAAGGEAASAEAGEDAGDLNEEIDSALLGLLTRDTWRETYDLIGGLVGVGVYALERLPRPSAAACIASIVGQLARMAETRPDGVTWFTPPEHLGPWAQPHHPTGHYNLGVAHGVPGVLPLLAAARRAGVAAAEAGPLLEGGVRWLLAQADRTGSISCFANSVPPDGTEEESTPARLAWCYGDAGIAAALLTTARLEGRPEWEREALAIARRGAERPVERAGVRDAGLCHGAYGLAHLYNRIYQATGDERFAEAARLWLREGLSLRDPGRGIAGFASWDMREGEPKWMPEGGFLTGVAGIGLALLAAVVPIEPEWDRVLLADIPERAGG